MVSKLLEEHRLRSHMRGSRLSERRLRFRGPSLGTRRPRQPFSHPVLGAVGRVALVAFMLVAAAAIVIAVRPGSAPGGLSLAPATSGTTDAGVVRLQQSIHVAPIPAIHRSRILHT